MKVLSRADRVALLPLYAAGEKPLRGIGSRQLYTSLKRRYPKLDVELVDDHSGIYKWVKKNVGYDDMVIFSGAGDVGKLGREVARSMK